MSVNPNPTPSQLPKQTPTPTSSEFAQRHYDRALAQIKLKQHNLALKELKDAIKLDPNNSQYHALTGKIHLELGMHGMATLSLRQALKLNPEDELALECQKQLALHSKQPKQATPDLSSRLREIFNKKLFE